MSLNYLEDARISVSPAAIEGWTYVRIELHTGILLASGRMVTRLEVVLDENGAIL